MATDLEKEMAERKKTSPILPKWTAVKGKYKVLADKKFFSSNIESPLSDLDEAVKSYTSSLEDRKKLTDIIKGMVGDAGKVDADLKKLGDEIEKNDALIEECKDADLLFKFQNMPEADPKDVLKVFDALCGSLDKAGSANKTMLTAKSKAIDTKITIMNKGHDDYKSQSDKVMAAMVKAGNDALNALRSINDALEEYLGVADEIDNAKLTADLKTFQKLVS